MSRDIAARAISRQADWPPLDPRQPTCRASRRSRISGPDLRREAREYLFVIDILSLQFQDRDGVTDAGELKGLDALGIVSLDVTAKPFEAVTSQGARLTGYGDLTFAGGITRRKYDAVNDNECARDTREAA